MLMADSNNINQLAEGMQRLFIWNMSRKMAIPAKRPCPSAEEQDDDDFQQQLLLALDSEKEESADNPTGASFVIEVRS